MKEGSVNRSATTAYHTCAAVGLVVITALAVTAGIATVAGVSVIACNSVGVGCSVVPTAQADPADQEAQAVINAILEARKNRESVHVILDPLEADEKPKGKK